MKTHRMYRQSRPEVPNILVLKPGVNYVPVEVLIRQPWFRDTYKAPGILVEPGVDALAYYDVADKHLELLAATSEVERQRLALGIWIEGPSKSYVLNGFDQHGNPVSETVNVPMLQNGDEPAILSEHSYSVLVGDDPYKAPEQVSNDAMHHIANGPGILPGSEATVENWQALYEILPGGQVINKPTLEYVDEIAPFDEEEFWRVRRIFAEQWKLKP